MAETFYAENLPKTGRDGEEYYDLLKKVEDLKIQSDINNKNKKSKPTIFIPEWLKDCESPFLWHTLVERGLGSDFVILRALEKLEELKIEEPEFSLQRFVTLLRLCVEYHLIDDTTKSWAIMKNLEELEEERVTQNDPFYQKIRFALHHVIGATKSNLFALSGQEEASLKMSNTIVPLKVMSTSEQAALQAMKARFFLYSGYEKGEDIGVSLARKAVELEPDNSEWEYLLAKMLRQQRREVPFSLDVPKEELFLLESAVQKDRQTKYLVYLAQVYRECGAQAFRSHRNDPQFYQSQLFKATQEMGEKALEYYKEALDRDSTSPAVLRRVGYGIMNLPKKVADYKLALKCLLRSQELLENQISLHMLGTYYHRYGNDNKKAVEYFEKTAKLGSHAGLSDMVRVKYLIDPEYDPCPDLEAGLKWELKKINRHQLLAQLGGYYLFIKRDFLKSIKYFKQIISEDKDCPHLQTFKSFFLCMFEPINMNHYLANEALLLLQEHNNSEKDSSNSDNEETPSDISFVEDFIDVLSEVYPNLTEITPDPSLIDKLIQASKEEEIIRNKNQNRNATNDASKFRGNGRGRGFNNRDRGYHRGGYRYQADISGDRRDRDSKASRSEDSHPITDNIERRGRFSIANQRDRDSNSESNVRGRGKNRDNPRSRYDNQDRQTNWRNEQRNQFQQNEKVNSGGVGSSWRKES